MNIWIISNNKRAIKTCFAYTNGERRDVKALVFVVRTHTAICPVLFTARDIRRLYTSLTNFEFCRATIEKKGNILVKLNLNAFRKSEMSGSKVCVLIFTEFEVNAPYLRNYVCVNF